MIPLHDLNPARRLPLVTYLLVAVNVAIYVLQVAMDEASMLHVIRRWGLVPYYISSVRLDSVVTLFTSMFLHNGWAHLLSNMWFLHIFGDNVEDELGRGRFALFYLACGLGAACAHVLSDPQSQLPMVGASGCVSGVMAAYLMLFPNARIVTFMVIFFRAPAVFFIVFWFVMQLLFGLGSLRGGLPEDSGVAFFAHIGGFLAGLVLLRSFRPAPPSHTTPSVPAASVPTSPASELKDEHLGERC